MKIKFIPIQLNWAHEEEASAGRKLEGRTNKSNLVKPCHVSKERWLQIPVAVRATTGILGPVPDSLSCGDEQIAKLSCTKGASVKRAGDIPNLSPIANPIPIQNPNLALARFVKHLWQKPIVKSFATAVRFEPAPVIPTMQSHGAGRRTGREGFGGGRYGHGAGCTGARPNTWKRKDEEKAEEVHSEEEDAGIQGFDGAWEGNKSKNPQEATWAAKAEEAKAQGA